MTKNEAIQLLGGSVGDAARAIGINSQAVSQWPEVLSARLVDRVQAALYRQKFQRKTTQTLTPQSPPAIKEIAHA